MTGFFDSVYMQSTFRGPGPPKQLAMEALAQRNQLFAEVAQSVEQGTENPRVGSSILSLGTNKIKGLAKLAKPFLFLKSILYKDCTKIRFDGPPRKLCNPIMK